MGKTAVGVDLVDVRRLALMIEDAGGDFLESVWTLAERTACGDAADRLAARWAAKEATMKALGVGIGTVDPIDIEVRVDDRGAPSVFLSRSAQARAAELNVESWSVSMSHEGGMALAVAVATLGD
ncbi:holo-[acyl-carrier protein] synthase [Leifsonia sp. AK011]|uniref:holo-ACP synthase n=1 Tax=Leifsonia sp. AK011 TaxID=2723075 RepID=UPI0015CCF941|nr:holo-ACP synthase [Leifsonia sp. AK011]NYF09923.1 holo-[acyl-carrier protein] synthase [Leifsonia sp. AK011]